MHCINFSLRALDFAKPSQHAQNVFVFYFPMTVSESPPLLQPALLCIAESLSLFFDFCFVFFFNVCFCTTVRFVRRERKKQTNYLRNS